MPTTLTNLPIKTYNSTTDSQSKFATFRGDICGVNNSNMTVIDAWAGTVNSKLIELENQKPTILINAIWINMGYYEATSSEIDEYKLDMLLTLRLDKDNDGTTTIKINSLPVKSLMKYGADGNLVNLEVGDLRIHHEYSFRYDGTSFVWQGGTSADQMNIVGNTGEIVTIASDKTLETSGVALTNVATKSQIKNNLTETTTGNILDATQGKILDDKIGVLSNLATTVKTDLVSAISENREQINDLNGKFSKTSIALLNGWTKLVGFKCEVARSGNILSVNALISNTVPNTLPIFNIGTALTEGVIKFAQNNEKQIVEIRVAVNGDVSFYTTPTQSAWYTLDFSINL